MKKLFEDKPKPFLEHFSELRTRILRILAILTILTAALLALPDIKGSIAVMIFKTLQKDLLPKGIGLIFIDSLEPIFVITKIALTSSVFIASPYMLFELLGFVAPALLGDEFKYTIGMILFGFLLLLLGITVSYLWIIPVTFKVLIHYGTAIGGLAQITFNRFFSMLVIMFFSFALPFELPVIMIFLARAGIVSVQSIKRKRKYMYLSFS